MAIQQAVVAVPARLQSSRLPNKVLAEIGGKPMIQRVLERCREASTVQAVVLCTDSSQLQQLAEGWGFPVLMTSPDCSSGSERIASVADQLMALPWREGLAVAEQTAVINVQGDQPFIDPAVIDESMRVLGFNRHRAGFRSLLAPGEAEDAASVASAETPVDDAAGTLFASGDGEVSVTATPSLTPVDGDYRIISTLEELEEIVDRSRDAGLVAIDTETDSLGPRTAKLAGVSITIAEGQGVYVPLRSPAPESHLDLEAARPALARLLGDPKIGKIGHNLKFDLVVLRAHGLEVRLPATSEFSSTDQLQLQEEIQKRDPFAKPSLLPSIMII